MPCEWKHVEAIQVAFDQCECGKGIVELNASIDAALAACDESPCVWRIDGYIMRSACGAVNGEIPTYCNPEIQRVQAIYCPHCGRKIAPLPAAPDSTATTGVVESKEEGK